MIDVQAVDFAYESGRPLLRQFSWSVGRGEAWAIVGPSGCGKTSLLYLLAGLRRPTAGQVLIDGRPIAGPRSATGLILQDYGLLPWARVWENAALGLRIRGEPAARARAAADGWLVRLGLADYVDRYPAELSGGQRQRVAIARALASNPDLLLMDEPFASLDAFTREELQDLLRDLRLTRDLTMVVVTHDIAEAVYLADRILVLHRPPHEGGRTFANPGAGANGWRDHPDFYHRCAAIRAAVRDESAKPGERGLAPKSEAVR